MKGSIKSCFLEMKVNISFLLFLLFSLAGHAQDSETIVFLEKPMAVNLAHKDQSVTLVCRAEKNGHTISYQWYQSSNASVASGTEIPGANADTFMTEVFSKKEIRYYYCVATSDDGESVTSDVVMAAHTGLPTLYVNTVDGEEPTAEFVFPPDASCYGIGLKNATKVPSNMQILNANGDTIYESGEYEKKESGLTIKMRGNTSASLTGKTPYKLKLQKKADLLASLLSRDDKGYKSKEWILLKDGTSLNTFVGMAVADIAGTPWTPEFAFVNLVINNNYRGIYMLIESISKGDKRVNISDDGYIIERDAYWWNEEVKFITSKFVQKYTFKYPDEDEITAEQLSYIEDYMNILEEHVGLGTYEDFIDLDSFTRWLLVHDILGTWDSAGSNVFMAKDNRQEQSKIYMLSNWDFDTSYWMSDVWSNPHAGTRIYAGFLFQSENRKFTEFYKNQWDKISSTLLTSVMDELELLKLRQGEEINLSRQCDAFRWNVEYTSVEDNIRMTEDWFESRSSWLNDMISGEHNITYNLNGGKFLTETGHPQTYGFESFFTLATPQKTGYEFIGWTYDTITPPQKNLKLHGYKTTTDLEFTANWKLNLSNSEISIDPIPDGTYTGLVYTPEIVVRDNEKVLTQDEDYSVILPEDCVNAGNHVLTIVGKGDYAGERTVTFSIAPAPLTITAQPTSITYGDELANINVEYSGFVNGETESSLSGTLSWESNYTQYDDVGEYIITPQGLSSNNYAISYVDATLTVLPKEIDFEWRDTTLTYTGLEQVATVALVGMINNDSCNILVSGGQTNVGTYVAKMEGLDNRNYKFPDTLLTKEYTIAPAPLTITAQPTSITYGDELPDINVEYSGFVNGETESLLSGTLIMESDYTQYSHVGEYTIVLKGLSSNNYAISYVESSLSVLPKEVNLEWADTVFSYTGLVQIPSVSVIGLLNNDSCKALVFGGQSEAGDFIVKVERVDNSNYKLPNTLLTKRYTIAKVPLTITALPATLTYGDELMGNGVEYSGFVNGETEADLEGTLTYEYSCSQFEGVGEYLIKPQGLKSNNYRISYVAGKLVINPREIEIEWVNTTFLYNGQDQVADAIAIGLVNGDSCETIVSGAQVNTGTYVAQVTGIKNNNYKLPETNLEKEFTIHPASIEDLVIVVDASSLAYDGLPKTPAIIVKDGETVIPAEEYSVIYSDNLNKGVAKVAVIDNEGGNYVVSGVTTFVITEANAIMVWSQNGSLFIDSPVGTPYRIYDVNGHLHRNTETSAKLEEVRMGVDGVYVVVIGNNSYKLIVKN